MKCLHPFILPSTMIAVPCGKCINCCVNYSRQWAVRCMDELAVNNGVGFFLTLTYAESDGDLHREDLQKFIKRLRARIAPVKIRFFYCGEYGGKNNRPHYHLMIFGWRPEDLQVVSVKGALKYYKSDFLQDIWKLGFISIGDITFESSLYCAKYLQKLDPREHKVKPFTGMSLKPGLGVLNFSYRDLINEKRYIGGQVYSLPRYYIDKAEQQGYNVDFLRLHRKVVSAKINGCIDFDVFEELKNEEERLLNNLNKIVLT